MKAIKGAGNCLRGLAKRKKERKAARQRQDKKRQEGRNDRRKRMAQNGNVAEHEREGCMGQEEDEFECANAKKTLNHTKQCRSLLGFTLAQKANPIIELLRKDMINNYDGFIWQHTKRVSLNIFKLDLGIFNIKYNKNFMVIYLL